MNRFTTTMKLWRNKPSSTGWLRKNINPNSTQCPVLYWFFSLSDERSLPGNRPSIPAVPLFHVLPGALSIPKVPSCSSTSLKSLWVTSSTWWPIRRETARSTRAFINTEKQVLVADCERACRPLGEHRKTATHWNTDAIQQWYQPYPLRRRVTGRWPAFLESWLRAWLFCLAIKSDRKRIFLYISIRYRHGFCIWISPTAINRGSCQYHVAPK